MSAALGPALDALRWQFEMAWALTEHYLPQLTDEACLWEPAPGAWTVRLVDGAWVPDWSEEETDTLTTSAGWLCWHVAWWWSEALASHAGEGPVGREHVLYPGTVDGVREQLASLASRWRTVLSGLDDDTLARPSRFPWPEDEPFAQTVAWLHCELMKNVAEIGLTIRLHAACRSGGLAAAID